jgi:putative DNA primase/helicase
MIQNPYAEQGTSPPNPNPYLEAALSYAARGWAIFPLVPGSKKPFGKAHECGAPSHQHGFKDATTDPAIITAWWTEHPDANIGVATGKVSGVTSLIERDPPVARRWRPAKSDQFPVVVH